MARPAKVRLTDRLVDRFMLFGLACVFLCVTTAVALAGFNLLSELMAATVSLPLLALLFGGSVLRQAVRVNALVEDQLRAAAGGEAFQTLKPVAATEAVARGWNRIVQQLQDQRGIESLNERLNQSVTQGDQQRWHTVYNLLGDGLAICDQDLKILEANNSLAALLKVATRQDLLGAQLTALLSGLNAGASSDKVNALSLAPGRSSAEIQLGPELAAGVLRISRIPIEGDGFGSQATLWTVRDVTQHKLADEMRNQFLSTATHELRTPLTNILSYAELLANEDRIDLEKQKTFCNVINAEATRLSRFVDQLLNVSQLEAGALALVRHETDIERLLTDVADNVRPQAIQKSLLFESRLPPKVPKLTVDKDKLSASLVNLLGNAIKYTPDKGRVTLSAEVTADQMHFHVEDTGIGIAADELPRLAEKFFRSKDARVQECLGSGLGLAFTQEVARLHGGRLTVRSELNKGSRFTLSLPLA